MSDTAETYEMRVAQWQREHAKLKDEIVSRVIRMIDNRPPRESDHPNLKRVYEGIHDLMSHHYPKKTEGGYR